MGRRAKRTDGNKLGRARNRHWRKLKIPPRVKTAQAAETVAFDEVATVLDRVEDIVTQDVVTGMPLDAITLTDPDGVDEVDAVDDATEPDDDEVDEAETTEP